MEREQGKGWLDFGIKGFCVLEGSWEREGGGKWKRIGVCVCVLLEFYFVVSDRRRHVCTHACQGFKTSVRVLRSQGWIIETTINKSLHIKDYHLLPLQKCGCMKFQFNWKRYKCYFTEYLAKTLALRVLIYWLNHYAYACYLLHLSTLFP